MKSVLTIDIGNQRTKTGLFQDFQLTEQLTFLHKDVKDLLNFLQEIEVQSVIISATSVINQDILQILKVRSKEVLILDENTPLPIEIQYLTPSTLGRDRLAAAVGASTLFPGSNLLIIDAGTCITYDFVTSGPVFIGGNIAPGLQMRLKAMDQMTANLPLVQLPTEVTWIGRSTEEALQMGSSVGVLWEIQGYVEYAHRHYGEITVLLTGGDADFLVKHMKTRIFVYPNLILTGLHQILMHNNLYEEP